MLPPGELRSRGLVDRSLLTGSSLLFLVSALGTVAWCFSMSRGMSMPGGWTMSMAWMPMAGQSWAVAAGAFLGMWGLMMVAMMLPSLVPALASYRRSLAADGRWWPTFLMGAGYFSVWVGLGAGIFPFGVGLSLAAMRWERVASTVPVATGGLLMLAGWIQLSAWKRRLLGRCRRSSACSWGPPDARSAWKQGVHLGVVCVLCCAGFTLTLLVLGVMDVRVMALVAAAITLERLAPWPGPVARASGGVVLGLGLLVLVGVLPLT